MPSIDTERKFYGLWTFERPLVEQAAQILIHRMEAYNQERAQQLTQIRQSDRQR